MPEPTGAPYPGDTVRAILAQLRYHVKWLEYGLIDEDFLRAQAAAFAVGEDKHTEHYRYAAFCHVLATRASLDDSALERYVELTELDGDPGVAEAARADLIRWRGLTKEQCQGLALHPAFTAPTLRNLMTGRQLLRELRSAPLTEEVFERCLACGMAFVQGELLRKTEITRAQVERIAAQGASRAVRKIAKERLRRRT